MRSSLFLGDMTVANNDSNVLAMLGDSETDGELQFCTPTVKEELKRSKAGNSSVKRAPVDTRPELPRL